MSFSQLLIGSTLACASAAAFAGDLRETYIVRLNDAPLVEHARQLADARGLLHALGEKPAVRRLLESAEGSEYLRRLDAAREHTLAAGAAVLGRNLVPRHVFRHTGNGMSLSLTAAEAVQLARVPGIAGVRRERRERLLTDAGPQWIGADQLWSGQVQGVAATKGEGVVIGIVDGGINATHPSFAASGPDGFTVSNPRGHFYGLCATGEATCTAKLIGIYDFTDEGSKGLDTAGHGTHVSGIAAGNAISDALQGHTVALSRQVSGVAPHANLIMYKACVSKDAANPDGGCPESALVAALDQAVADGVDVINFSIGGDAEDPYALLAQGDNDTASMFEARAAGVVVVAAAGNEGPGPHSIDTPGNAPWVIAVANATHNRRFADSIGGFSGAAGAPATLAGAGYTAGYGPASIVYAGNFGNALCGTGDSEGVNPTGASNPFAAGTFHGEIVICDRGTYARVEKGYNVLHAGAGGYVLANAPSDGESIVSDDHFLPAVHLGFDEGQLLKMWLSSSGAHTGTISGVSAALDPQYGDVLEASSSRGPYGLSGGVLKPDITAPGTNILSADLTGTGLALKTGTSMASPHVAGAAALLIAAHPTWSPAQVESALLGTALGGSVRTDTGSSATPLDAGAGRAQPAAAVRAGLYLPLDANAIRAQDPAHGGDPARLNRPGIENEACLSQCSFTRSVTDMSAGGTWQVSVTASDGAHVTVTPTQFTLAAGATQALSIAVDVSDPRLPGSWVYGSIVLHKAAGGQGASDTTLPLAVYASPGVTQPFQEITANAPGGNAVLNAGGLVPLPIATFGLATLAPAQTTSMSLGVDPTPDDLYSKFPGTGKQFVLFPLLNGVPNALTGVTTNRVFIAEIAASNAPQTRLLVGIDSNGDEQPNFAEQTCESTTLAGSTARCVLDLRDAPLGGNVWALVDVPDGQNGTNYAVTLSAGLPAVGSPQPVMGGSNFSSGVALTVTGPGHVPQGAAFPLRLSWNNQWVPNTPFPPTLAPGRSYGAVLIDSNQGYTGQTSILPFGLTRMPGGNDVADATRGGGYVLSPGESLRHVFVDVPGPGTLNLNTFCAEAAQCPGEFAVYVARADFPDFSAAAEVADAPPSSAAVAQWTFGGSTPGHQAQIPVTAGRWYIVAANTGSAAGYFALIPSFTPSAAIAQPTPGPFFNPQRSGHGIFISRAGDQQVVYWYTFLENGTPTWYAAQGNAPTDSTAAWSAPLFRTVWTGSTVNSHSVLGDMILTPIDANEFMFSWHLEGRSGSERFVRIGVPDACVGLNGTQVHLDGQWFAPAQSGYGMDVLALQNFQQDTFYFYDGLGQPVWAAGSSAFAAGSTFPMFQISGFCPLCTYTPTTTQGIGSLSVNFSNPTQGSYVANLNLQPPLSGAWNINQPTLRITGSASCVP